MLAKVAWRNLWRNPRRTLLSMSALTLGAAALAFSHSFYETTYASMVDLATRGIIGHLQVLGAGYQAEPSVFTVVPEPGAVGELVTRAFPGATVRARVSGHGLAAAGERSSPVLVTGVDPDRETGAGGLLVLASGRPMTGPPAREVVVAASLARRLRLEVGGELVLLSQGADGSLANDLYRVVGLAANTGDMGTGGAALFLHLAEAQSFFALGGGVHQLVVRLPDGVTPEAAAGQLRPQLEGRGLEVKTWRQLVPELESSIEADRTGSYFLDAVVFLVVVLGMWNAMSMATWERTFELGLLSALGTRPLQVMGLVVLESLFIGALSLASGLVLAAVVIAAMPSIEFTAFQDVGFAGISMPPELEVRLDPLAVEMSALTLLATSVIAGVFPAWRAARKRPVEAMGATS